MDIQGVFVRFLQNDKFNVSSHSKTTINIVDDTSHTKWFLVRFFKSNPKHEENVIVILVLDTLFTKMHIMKAIFIVAVVSWTSNF